MFFPLLELLFIIIAIILVFYFLIPVLIGAPYLPSQKEQVARMIKMAEIKPGDKIIDLGSGDGRLLIAAAQIGAEGIGYEIDPLLVWWSRKKIKKLGLTDKVKIYWRNFWRVDFSSADIIFVFGAAHIMKKLEKKLLRELKPGAKVISLVFPFPDWIFKQKENGIFLYQK